MNRTITNGSNANGKLRKIKIYLITVLLLGMAFVGIMPVTADPPLVKIANVFLYFTDFLGWPGDYYATVDAFTIDSPMTDDKGDICFYVEVDAYDDSIFYGAHFLVLIESYERKDEPGATWEYHGRTTWEITSGDWETFHNIYWIPQSEHLQKHETNTDFKYIIGALIDPDYEGYDVDDGIATVWDVNNDGYENYQQVVDIDKPIPTASVGQENPVIITGEVRTEDGQGEPVSDTPVHLIIQVFNENPLTGEEYPTGHHSDSTTTDPAGQFSFEWNIPNQNRYSGTAKVYVQDEMKDDNYDYDPDGDKTEFIIQKNPNQPDIKWQWLELDQIDDVRIYETVTISGIVEWYPFSGGLGSPCSGAPVQIDISVTGQKIILETTTGADGRFEKDWTPNNPIYIGLATVIAHAKEHDEYMKSNENIELFTIKPLGGDDPPPIESPIEWPENWEPGYFLIPGIITVYDILMGLFDELIKDEGEFVPTPYTVPSWHEPAEDPPYILTYASLYA